MTPCESTQGATPWPSKFIVIQATAKVCFNGCVMAEQNMNESVIRDENIGKVDVDPMIDKNAPAAADRCRSAKMSKGSAWSRLSRELSDDDLNQPGTKKMILDKLDNLSDENESLKSYQAKFYDVDKKYAVIIEKYKAAQINVRLIDVFSMIGTLMLGLVPWLYDHNAGFLIILLDVGVAISLVYFPRRMVSNTEGVAK